MLSVEVSPYTLRQRFYGAKEREGALLKIDFGGDAIGYCDCHLWPELGDPTLPIMLEEIRKGNYDHPYFHPMLLNAFYDMQARAIDSPLCSEELPLYNHYTVTDILEIDRELLKNVAKEGFQKVKVKIRKNCQQEVERLVEMFGGDSSFSLRLDFNGRLTKEEYLVVVERLKSSAVAIDFCEDPFPYDFDQWCSVQEETGVALAADRCKEELFLGGDFPFVVVIKPAVDDIELLTKHLSGKRFVVTSYLDHPVGQVTAAYHAHELEKKFPENKGVHGLLSHRVYEQNSYAVQLSQKGPLFSFPKGGGVGFEELLKREEWSR